MGVNDANAVKKQLQFERGQSIAFDTPASTKLKGGYIGFTSFARPSVSPSVSPSVRPSVDRIVSALYPPQY